MLNLQPIKVIVTVFMVLTISYNVTFKVPCSTICFHRITILSRMGYRWWIYSHSASRLKTVIKMVIFHVLPVFIWDLSFLCDIFYLHRTFRLIENASHKIRFVCLCIFNQMSIKCRKSYSLYSLPFRSSIPGQLKIYLEGQASQSSRMELELVQSTSFPG